MKLLVLAALATVLMAAGCGGGSDEATLRDGVYEFELSEEYLLSNGIGAEQAKRESGIHRMTLEGSSFVDHWRTADGTDGSCGGTFTSEGNRVALGWTFGCAGDWEMSYTVDGDTVTWSDIQSAEPYTEEDQKINEVFNSVPWTRVGDVPSQ